MNPIFVLGSINMDMVFAIDKLPKAGETVTTTDFFMTPGGKGANQAVACAKQGIKTYLIGSIGTDLLSMDCKQALQQHGVDTTYLQEYEDLSCGIAGILLEDSDNRILIHGGANDHHDIASIRTILEKQAGPNDILIAQLELPMPVVVEILKIGKQCKMKTMLNAAPAKLIPDELYPYLDVICLNETETATLSGINPIDESSIRAAASVFRTRGAASVLITLGERGSVYVDTDQCLMVPAEHVDVIDTTSAGDTYLGVFATECLRGSSIEDAMQQATTASALAIQRRGAQQSIPTRLEIEAYQSKKRGQTHE